MSSYLVAFIISDFDYVDNLNTLATDRTYHRVYARPDDVGRTELALRGSISALEEL